MGEIFNTHFQISKRASLAVAKQFSPMLSVSPDMPFPWRERSAHASTPSPRTLWRSSPKWWWLSLRAWWVEGWSESKEDWLWSFVTLAAHPHDIHLFWNIPFFPQPAPRIAAWRIIVKKIGKTHQIAGIAASSKDWRVSWRTTCSYLKNAIPVKKKKKVGPCVIDISQYFW